MKRGVRLLLTGKDYWVSGGINANLQGGSGLEEHAGSPSGWDSGSPQEMMATKSGSRQSSGAAIGRTPDFIPSVMKSL